MDDLDRPPRCPNGHMDVSLSEMIGQPYHVGLIVFDDGCLVMAKPSDSRISDADALRAIADRMDSRVPDCMAVIPDGGAT